MIAPAQYLGLQPGFRHIPAIELYNLLAPVGEHPRVSTDTRETLEKHRNTHNPRISAPPKHRNHSHA